MIDANIRALGFRTEDIRLILSSHAHFDHVGGIAALQRASDAVVAASSNSAAALRDGRPTPDDPQYAFADVFPPVPAVRVVGDREKLVIGATELTSHFTPGHAPGGTTWSWRACESERCVDVVYADSLNAVSADGFRFSGSATRASIVDEFEESIRTVAGLPCDILLSPHSGFFGMRGKLEQRRAGRADAFIDMDACRDYASAAAERLERRIAVERSGP